MYIFYDTIYFANHVSGTVPESVPLFGCLCFSRGNLLPAMVPTHLEKIPQEVPTHYHQPPNWLHGGPQNSRPWAYPS